MGLTLVEELRAVAEKRVKPLLDRREQLRKELNEIDAEIASAKRAIAALEGKPVQPKSEAAKPSRKKRSNQKPSATAEAVEKVMVAVLKDAGGKLSKDEMRDAAKEVLRGEGYGLTGLKQRFDKILEGSEQFVCRGINVSIKTT